MDWELFSAILFGTFIGHGFYEAMKNIIKSSLELHKKLAKLLGCTVDELLKED